MARRKKYLLQFGRHRFEYEVGRKLVSESASSNNGMDSITCMCRPGLRGSILGEWITYCATSLFVLVLFWGLPPGHRWPISDTDPKLRPTCVISNTSWPELGVEMPARNGDCVRPAFAGATLHLCFFNPSSSYATESAKPVSHFYCQKRFLNSSAICTES